ncbi:hypothetical protein [Bacillus sp. TL12]|uniref:hypothetical protein n=1 Tax=Bacillus sp. TL12 TaxID=2894756 RepID=UPI001F5170B4|nr:hypothetical protein [Bacillus sp. TL12]MCI0765553.1 hypothetical protein [Bacillus sp. TL12]
MSEVKKAEIKLNFEKGFNFDSGNDLEEALRVIIDAIQSGSHDGIEVEFQYVDESEVNFTNEEGEEEEDGEDEDEEEDGDEEEEDGDDDEEDEDEEDEE